MDTGAQRRPSLMLRPSVNVRPPGRTSVGPAGLAASAASCGSNLKAAMKLCLCEAVGPCWVMARRYRDVCWNIRLLPSQIAAWPTLCPHEWRLPPPK